MLDIEDLEIPQEEYHTTIYENISVTYYSALDAINPQLENRQNFCVIPRRRGPKVRGTIIPSKMLCVFFIRGKPPKKEYIRCKLIRGHKRAIRHAIANKIPRTTIHKINPLNEYELKSWTIFADDVRLENHRPVLEVLSRTVNGPLTDGASRREIITPETLRSFSDSFCQSYFSNELILESYKKYVDIIFATQTPENLCKRFGFKCCQNEDNEDHYQSCDEKWCELKKYILKGMLEELEIGENEIVPVQTVENSSIEVSDIFDNND